MNNAPLKLERCPVLETRLAACLVSDDMGDTQPPSVIITITGPRREEAARMILAMDKAREALAGLFYEINSGPKHSGMTLVCKEREEMKIPKGWRKLRRGTLIADGDKFLLGTKWEPTGDAGRRINKEDISMEMTYIRRIKRKAVK